VEKSRFFFAGRSAPFDFVAVLRLVIFFLESSLISRRRAPLIL
jgi:hypothetical protein